MPGPLYFDRVKETTTTAGTGTYTLAGAVADFQAFSVVGNANTCYYAITDGGTGWEVGLGTYTLAGTTLARTTVLASSNAGSAVSWGAGSKIIWLDVPAAAASQFAGRVSSRTALATAVDTSRVVWLEEASRQGAFQWSSANNAANVTNDPGQGVYVPPASDTTGASGAWVRIYPQSLNVKWFGATGDGSTDDTTALQRAITLGVALGASVFIPKGGYKVTTALSVIGAIQIFGEGNRESLLQPAAAIICLSINCNPGPTLENFGIQYASQGTSGASGVYVTATTECSGFYARSLRITSAYRGIQFLKASQWVVDGCAVIDSTQTGIFVENQNNVDSGDSTIANCLIYNPTVTGATNGIIWRSSGGMRIVNNKINNFQIGINFQLADTAVTGDMLITGNSIEAVGFAGVLSGISFQRLGTTGTFHSVLITGNQLNGWAAGIQVTTDANGSWLTNLSIVGNVIYGNTGAAATCVIVHATTNFTVCDNTFRSGIAASIPVTAGATADTGVIGPNIKTGSWSADGITSTNTLVIGQTPGVIGPEQISLLTTDFTGSNVNTAQPVFSSAQDVLTVAASTTYEFEAEYQIDTTGATSNSLGLLFALSGATLTSIAYTASATNGTTSTTPSVPAVSKFTVATVVNVTAAVAAATQRTVSLRGTIRVNAGGTLTPQFQYSAAPGAAPVVRANSFFRLWPIGSDTVAALGPWA